jgi:hypothetical protein
MPSNETKNKYSLAWHCVGKIAFGKAFFLTKKALGKIAFGKAFF